MEMSRRKWVTIAIATGALVGSAGIAGAVTGSSTTSNPPSSSAPKYNTDPAHEAGESAQRKADEASGKAGFGGPGGHSNTDPAHEAGESAARKAEEAQRDAGTSSDTSGTSSATPGQ